METESPFPSGLGKGDNPGCRLRIDPADVDPKRIAIQGISQGGFWVPRAIAFEPRIAAAIADPGVVDVATSWTGSLPPPMLELLKAGRKAEFDAIFEKTLSPAAKSNLNFRMRPYGFTSYFDTYTALSTYNLRTVANQIRCPILITAPANEAYCPDSPKSSTIWSARGKN